MFARPSVARQRGLDLRLGMMLRFGINSYRDMEWRDGPLDPARFDPNKLDTDTRCESPCAAGMKFVTPASKYLDGRRKVMEFEGREVCLPLQIETTLSKMGPPGPSANGGWFWIDGDQPCATLLQIAAWKQKAAELDAVLLLRSGIMTGGGIRPEEQALHRAIGRGMICWKPLDRHLSVVP